MNIPIIRLEVENMRHTLAVAMSEYTLKLDDMLQDAINAYCTPENIKAIVYEEAHRQLHSIIQHSVREWFVYSDEGQKLIKQAVAEKLREEAKFWSGEDA